jgi:putative colanic acid biosynthesis UDP-glucose lipid carrier transferase
MLETAVKEQALTEERKKIDTQIANLRDYIETRRYYLTAKRVFDIVFSLLAILFIFSWLFPIIWILIKLDSRGPAFFIQRRVGFLGRSFPCLKFRTMCVNSEANSKQATENDPRITRMGRFLRKSNLDEMPQFLNVLAGHMSIVGPRPHMYNDCLSFSRAVGSYKFRNLMKPGITGLAQVKGYRGPAQSFEKIFRRYQWDAFYIRNAGFLLDMRIVHRTAVQTVSYLFSRFTVIENLPDMSIRKEWIDPSNVFN